MILFLLLTNGYRVDDLGLLVEQAFRYVNRLMEFIIHYFLIWELGWADMPLTFQNLNIVHDKEIARFRACIARLSISI
jgi:hypothetical protein